MAYNREFYLIDIIDRISLFKSQVELRDHLNLFDINHHAEVFYAGLLNLTYDYQLKVGEFQKKNMQVIDLYDDYNRIAVQVTSDTSANKVSETLNKFAKKRYAEKYDRQIIFIITEKVLHKRAYESLPDCGIKFDPERDILDVKDLIKKIYTLDTIKLKEIDEYLETEINLVSLRGDRNNPDTSGVPEDSSYEDYYQYIIHDKLLVSTASELVGKENLAQENVYIKPFVKADTVNYPDKWIREEIINNKEKRFELIPLIETWVQDTKAGVMLVYGEPGHGKTSLCWKFIERFVNNNSSSFCDSVKNIFWFSLNPASSKILDYQFRKLNFDEIFTWGNGRSNKIPVSESHNSLVFLDGFDEMLPSAAALLEGFSLYTFVLDYVQKMCPDSHVIITARTISIRHQIKNLGDTTGFSSFELCPMSFEQQDAWIDSYMKRISGQEYYSMLEYLPKFHEMRLDGKMTRLLEIPILFRMIVHARFFSISDNIMDLYHKLFEETLCRHSDRSNIHRFHLKFEELAEDIFRDDDDTAVIDPDLKDSSWLFSFYLHEDDLRAGFLHRSFYQYFLSHRIFNMLNRKKSEKEIVELLNLLGLRYLDSTIISYISMLSYDHACKKKAITWTANYPVGEKRWELSNEDKVPFLEVLKYLDNQGGMARTCLNYSYRKEVNDFVLMETITGNAIAIINTIVCGINFKDLYNLKDALSRFHIPNMNIENADLRIGSWGGMDLSNAYLNGVVGDKIEFTLSDFDGSECLGARLDSADFSYTSIRRVNFTGTHLEKANFSHSRATGVIFRNCVLKGASFHCTSLFEADFCCADLTDADFTGAVFQKELFGVSDPNMDLICIKFDSSTILNGTIMPEIYKEVLIDSGADLGAVKWIHNLT